MRVGPIWISIVGVAVFSTVLGACVPPQPPPQPASDVDYVLCSSSGWYGIIPSTTSVESATKILSNLPFVSSNSIKYSEKFLKEPSVEWQQTGAIPARRRGAMQVHDDRIVSIRAPLLNELSLQQALKNCGAPALVRASYDGETPFHWYEFFYPDKGILLIGIFEREQLDSAIIAPGIRIIEVEHFPPSDIFTYLTNIRRFTSRGGVEAYAKTFVAWPGLNGIIPAYPF